jgi:hypothetical protein
MCIHYDSELEALVSIHCRSCVPSLAAQRQPSFIARPIHAPYTSHRCWSFAAEAGAARSMIPSAWKDLLRTTSSPILAIYGTLFVCKLVYPIWCLVAFCLKNSTKCCGNKHYSFGI